MDRDLDIKIAQEVFGYKVEERTIGAWDEAWGNYPIKQLQMLVKSHPKEMISDMNGEVWEDPEWEEWEKLPNYSTDIKDAWKIVEFFIDNYSCAFDVSTAYSESRVPSHHYSSQFSFYDGSHPNINVSKENTAPLAICKVALKTLEKE